MGRLAVPRPADLEELASDTPPGLFDERFHLACMRLDRFIEVLAVRLAATLELAPGAHPNATGVIDERGWNPAARWSLQWLFETLAAFDRAEESAGGWVIGDVDCPSDPATLRAEAVAAWPAAEPAYRLIGLCADALPAVLAGEVKGEDALFSPATLGLWFDYFSNENPHYAPNNLLTAWTLAPRVSAGCRILELGGGGGSAAEAVFAELSRLSVAPASYAFTELHPAFLRRGGRVAQRSAPEGCVVSVARADVDADLVGQGLDAGGFDAVFAVNTLHLAHDPVAAIERIGEVMRPGGTLVLGELVRPPGRGGVHLELPFTLLGAFIDAPLIDGVRPRPGFMTLAGWREAFRRAGFAPVEVVPAQLDRCMDAYGGFYCAALAARRN